MNNFVFKLPSSVGKKRAVSTTARGSSKKQQLHLNFGQKPIGRKAKTCPLCGMIYIEGVVENENIHSRICSKVSVDTVIKLSGISNYRVIHRYNDKEYVVECKIENISESMKSVFSKMNTDLGSPPDFVSKNI